MAMRRFASFTIALAVLLAGCGSRPDGPVNVSVIGSGDIFAEANGVRLGPAAQLLRAATVEGLVGFDEQGRVVPALADKWIVTEGGQSYIFRLRDSDWPDGTPITGESAATALRRTIAALRGTALARDLAAIDEIRAMAGRVVEIRLTVPVPDFLDLLAQPELGLPARGKGAGPMRLSREGPVASLEPLPPEARGMPAQENWRERVRELRVRFEPAEAAVERFNDGYSDIVLGGTIDTLPLVSTFGLSRGNLKLDPVIGLFGLMVMSDRGLLADAADREALAMAIDRESLVAGFDLAGWQPTTRIVSPEVADDLGTVGERWEGLDLAARQRIAASRVAQWKEKRGSAPRLRIALPRTPGGTLIYQRLRTDYAAIGLSVVRVEIDEPADLRLYDVVARYGRAAWFLNQLSCGARRAVCSEKGDEVALAAMAAAADARAGLLAEAEAEITAENGFIPFARPVRWSLVRGDITGFATNPWGLHPLFPLAFVPR